MDEEKLQHLKDLRQIYSRRLYKLEKRAAQFGAHTEPHVLTEIEDIRDKISDIDEQFTILERVGSSEVDTLRVSDLNLLLKEIKEIKEQNYQLASTVAELREVIFSSRSISNLNQARQLTGIWVDTAFGDQIKYSGIIGKHFVVTYIGHWPGVYFGLVHDGVFRFSWTRFDGTLSGKGYLRIEDSTNRMEGGIWFDDRDIDEMLLRDTFLERHILVRRSSTLDNVGKELLQKASQFLVSQGFIRSN